jgi:hypothetical protein
MSFLKNKTPRGFTALNWNVCFVAFLVIGISCREQQPVTAAYYNIDSLLDKQIGLLLKRKAALEKTAIVGPGDSRVTFVPADSAAWADELDIFRNLNTINKPVNRGLYIDSVYKDRNSNLTVRSFTATTPELQIERLEIFYLNAPKDIRRIEAIFHEENVMFETKRLLRMDFRRKDQDAFVSAYSIDGGQKMLLGDTVQYSVTAKISLPQN